MEEKQIYFIRGCCVTIFMFATIGLLTAIFLVPDKPREPVEKFKVVDKYKNCTVVRYTDPANRWHYLLHCGL